MDQSFVGTSLFLIWRHVVGEIKLLGKLLIVMDGGQAGLAVGGCGWRLSESRELHPEFANSAAVG